jgi:hypothetical protein
MTVCLMLSLVTATGAKRIAGIVLFPMDMAAADLTVSPFARARAASAARKKL